MLKLSLVFSLVPSIALAHPGHHGESVSNDAFTILATWYGAIAVIAAVTYVVARLMKRVRS